ncbi:hypothetical protein PINS_up011437 [Pythium insidiosum]|nr:hypothetical protein PINS_up011437 [Pythium insidiosum]
MTVNNAPDGPEPFPVVVKVESEASVAHVVTKETMAKNQLEVRVKNLSLTTQVTSHDDATKVLPTLKNIVWGGLKAMVPGQSRNTTVVTKHILRDVSAVLRPGTMTLVLGQPGSGKSSLLKALSGRLAKPKSIQAEGEITFNGIASEAVRDRVPQFAAYVAQYDSHFPTLTVEETLAFAYACATNPGSRGDQGLASEKTNGLHPNEVINGLGLAHARDTVVGDEMIRGVSGGERKRVTVGEMAFGDRSLECLDEISTGLDSATTFDIISALRDRAKTLRKTVVTALLQPAPEVFALFDDVIILNDGYVLYNGPCDEVEAYFRQLGFVRPPYRDLADFLMDLGTSQQNLYTGETEQTRAQTPLSPEAFSLIFRQSDLHRKILEELDRPSSCDPLSSTSLQPDVVPIFHQTFWESTKTLIRREMKVTWRNRAFLQGRAVVVTVIGLMYATLFYQFDPKNVQVVMGTIFPALLFFALGQSTRMPLYIEARDIFYKQRAANMYRTVSFVVASSLSQVPLALIEVIVFGSFVYWFCGFVGTAGAFINFLVLLFLTNLAFAAWFLLLASLSPDIHVAEPLGLLTTLFYILFGGFIITQHAIPKFFTWAFWVNPISWGLRALAVNQYRQAEFDVDVYDGINYVAAYGKQMGVASLRTFEVNTERYWLWWGMVFMVASYIGFLVLVTLVLEKVRYDDIESHIQHPNIQAVQHDEDAQNYQQVETPRTLQTAVDIDQHLPPRQVVPVTLAFKDLWYSVPDPKNPKSTIDLLKGVSGYARPGTMTALMGSSGAGKTTLMDVIAGRKTGGSIRGQILLNGHEASDLAIRRCTGYCEQMDVHSEASTVREALMFSAMLRQDSSIGVAEKTAAVIECLEMLDLLPIADQIIRGSSVEQMKRVTIGVELAAQPSVLFLDEPTSGLDARSAKVIMDGVRKVARSGRTIVCTIHQPSSEVFSLFDNLLLLKRGGHTVYFGEMGPGASEMINYFEAFEGVPRLPAGYNPATWMLEVIGAGVNVQQPGSNTNVFSEATSEEMVTPSAFGTTDFTKAFESSRKNRELEAALAHGGMQDQTHGAAALNFEKKRAATNATQASMLMMRFVNLYWRTASYNLTRFVVNIILALILGLAFVTAKYDTYQGINAGIGLIFVAIVFVGAVAFNSVMPISVEDRAAFYRERASQTYSAVWYWFGATLIEIPYTFATTFVFTAVFFPMVGFTGWLRFFAFWIHASLQVLLQTYLGQLMAFALPGMEVAMIIGVMVTSIFFLFMGFNPPASTIPIGYRWLYHVAPPKYTFAILTSIVFGEDDCSDPSKSSELGCRVLRETPPTVPQGIRVHQYLEKVFEVHHDDLVFNTLMVLAYIVLFRVLALVALRYINHQKR